MTPLAKPLSLLVFVLALGLKPSGPNDLAGADCLYECEGSTCYDFGNHAQFCQEIRAKCLARCSGRRWWGAIAYSPPDEQFGFAFDYNNVEDAKKEAMSRCLKNGKACKLWAYYENECGAIAADGSYVAWGTAANRQAAEQRAVVECRKEGGKNCAVKVWSCSKLQ